MRMMNRRERRRAGVTYLNILRIVRGMSQEERELPNETLALVVSSQLVAEKPEGFFEDIDWDRLLEFIEKLVELILKLLPLFI